MYVFIECLKETYVLFSGLDAAEKEIQALMASVDILKLEKREHVRSKHIELSVVWF